MFGLPASLSVLVVDDDAAVRDAMQWMLEEAGFQAVCVGGGREALAFLQGVGAADVMLSDVNMPEMDGMELRQIAREVRPSLPVLLISGQQAPVGAGAFLPKPFRWETLLHAISDVLGQRRAAPQPA